MLNTTSSRISLQRRVLGAGAWSVSGYAASQVLRFGSNLLMTRLLSPDMFGVMAIAFIIMSGLTMLSDLGVRQSIIRDHRGNDPVFLNTAWAIGIVRGVMLWLVAVGGALLILISNHLSTVPKDSVYADPRLPYVISIVSFIAVIKGFNSTKISEASRNLALHRITLTDIAAQIAGLLLMLCWVAVDRSIWALVAGGICTALVRMVLSHTCLQGNPNRWQWDKSAVREITHFGKWILIASILGFFAGNGDRLLLGGIVDFTVLGTYAIAFFIYSAVDDVMSKLMNDVTLPALSEVVREKSNDLKVSYYRLHAVISLFSYFCAGVLMISGQSLIAFIYDPRYFSSGWMLQILAIALLATPFGVAAKCFVALGKPIRVSQIAAIRLVTLVLATLGGFHFFGLTGAVWGIALSFFSSVPVTIFYQARHGILDVRRELYSLVGLPVGMAAGMLMNTTFAHL